MVLIRDTGEAQPDTLALATTDLTATGEQIVARYASRWSIEQSIKDGKNLLGAGDAQSRLPTAVERTTPLGLANLTILVLWYDQAGQPAADLGSRRRAAPWYRHKRHVSVQDMVIAFLGPAAAKVQIIEDGDQLCQPILHLLAIAELVKMTRRLQARAAELRRYRRWRGRHPVAGWPMTEQSLQESQGGSAPPCNGSHH